MAKGIHYTQKEDNVILDCLSKYPTNLQYAFEQASSMLIDRPVKGVEKRYYNKLRKLSAVIATGSKRGVMANTKNTMRIGRLAPGTPNLKNKMIITALSNLPKEKAVGFILDNLSDADKISILNKIINNI